MALDRIASLAASALPFVGIALALANWNARPDRPWAWTAAVVMFLVMVAVPQGFQFAFRRSSKDVVKAALARTVATVNNGVVFGALTMIIPLTMRLAHAYGLVDDPNSLNRAMVIISGVYLVVMGNAMPRSLPPISSMQGHGARVQAFQRFAGWTWVLCGLGFVVAWLALPIGTARPVSMAFVGAAMIVTVLQLLRLIAAVRSNTLRA
ncbi:MAG TPA: hypothetical protein VFP91_23270 [Vicinamibacterales bacterium]|nr:hypothetical protein [Vicinamibacterales bacterium]